MDVVEKTRMITNSFISQRTYRLILRKYWSTKKWDSHYTLQNIETRITSNSNRRVHSSQVPMQNKYKDLDNTSFYTQKILNSKKFEEKSWCYLSSRKQMLRLCHSEFRTDYTNVSTTPLPPCFSRVTFAWIYTL